MTTRALFVSTAVAMSLVLSGCATVDGEPQSTPTPTATATAGPPPAYAPEGDAQDNKAYFDWVLTPVATVKQEHPGKALVNALVKAGFPKRKMQVTPDLTKTQLEADSVIVSVQINRSCLIAQRTNKAEYFSSIEPALKTGGCLIGITRKIDW